MLKDLGTIALFLGVVLNAYHYYKLHKWSKKEKSFELNFKLIKDLQDIRNKILKLQEESHSYSQQIGQYNYSIIVTDENGNQIPKKSTQPTQNLCYKIMKFQEKVLKLKQDYIFIIKFKNTIQKENFVDTQTTQKFIIEIENEIKNRFMNLFSSFCWWDETIKNHYYEAFPGISTYCNCDDLNTCFELNDELH